jgi:hypothetical protein
MENAMAFFAKAMAHFRIQKNSNLPKLSINGGN